MHAELRLGHGIAVRHNVVAMLMRRAGLAGLSGNRSPRRRTRPVDTPTDLVDLDAVAAALNSRSRKTLGWKTPAETLHSLLQSGVATTPCTWSVHILGIHPTGLRLRSYTVHGNRWGLFR